MAWQCRDPEPDVNKALSVKGNSDQLSQNVSNIQWKGTIMNINRRSARTSTIYGNKVQVYSDTR